jgi:hypothetical protein
MWIVFFLLLPLLFSSTLALADPGFSEQYERATISSIRPVSMRRIIR